MQGTRIWAEHPTVSLAQFDEIVRSVSNWGRWGPDDERGTLNLIEPRHVIAAARLVRSGRPVSMALDWNTVVGPDNPRPALHYMTQLGDRDPGEPQTNADFVGSDYHGKACSHIDALCHCDFRGKLYNGVPQSTVGSHGGTKGTILTAANGIVSRGVLIDVPRYRKVDWLEPGTAIDRAELEKIEAAQKVRVGAGDIVLIRSGHIRRRRALGAWDPHFLSAGLLPSAISWLHDREAAVLGADGDSDARPSPVEGMLSPIHALVLNAMGMLLLDNLQLEDVGDACAAEGRWEFLCVVTPLRIPGGTGSPINPVAIF
jgi:kynurenine formamidase